jgi:hypothetical protein
MSGFCQALAIRLAKQPHPPAVTDGVGFSRAVKIGNIVHQTIVFSLFDNLNRFFAGDFATTAVRI